VALARDHCSNGKATMSSLFVVELHITVDNKKNYYHCTKMMYGEFMSPGKTERTLGTHVKCLVFPNFGFHDGFS